MSTSSSNSPSGEDRELEAILRETASRFIEGRFPLAKVRALCDRTDSIDADYFRQTADMGWFAMLVPESEGGSHVEGQGMISAVVVAIERGRYLQPGPFVPMNAAAVGLSLDGSQAQKASILAQALRGETVITWAWGAMVGSPGGENALTVTRKSGGFIVRGTVDYVQDVSESTWVLVSTPFEGVTQFIIPVSIDGLICREMESLDLTRRFSCLKFEEVFVPGDMVLGGVGSAASTLARQVDIALVLTCAEATGAMSRDFEMALRYAKDRLAFGRPIGSFQSIKHLLANGSLLIEEAQAITRSAAHAVETHKDGSSHLASIAKAFVGDGCLELAQNCWQVFGGIGFTWDHDQHLYLRRLATDSALYGDPTWHREHLFQLRMS